MELFIDSANVNEIIECNKMGIIKGVTTNPTLLSNIKKNRKEVINEIINEINGPVNVEVLSLSSDDMIKEGKDLKKLSDNIVVKVPMGAEGLKAVNILKEEGINTNVTLIFSEYQAYLAGMAGATYVSPFMGRLDDSGEKGKELILNIKRMYEKSSLNTKIIAASIRNPVNVNEALFYGADYATVPYKVLMNMCKHNLTDKGIRKFLQDYHK